jgi:hypothetical protein
MLRIIVVAAIIFAGLSVTPAGADHDMVYAPCDPEDTRPVDERVWYIDYQSGDMLRFDDSWWGERPGFGRYTNWRHQCRLGMTGVWQAAPILPLPHPPTYEPETRATTTTTTPPTTTTTTPPTTTIPAVPSTTQPPPTTTEGISETPNPPSTTVPALSAVQPSTVDGYDLFDAEWDGYPFEQTILLLEERYPPGTPDRYHFRLSVAVEFLRQGGMIRGLDNLWETNS